MIKVDIVSGFLGSGKTTLIKRLLNAYKNEKVVLIENEFGEIGIDGEILKKDTFEIIELQSGCICCSIKTNFQDSILKIVEDIKPNRIIIEPTGIGLLSEIIDLINKSDLKEKCKINSLTTVIDSVNYFEYIDSFGDFYEDQIVNASTLLLSKTQFIKENEVNNIISSLRSLNNKAYIVSENWDDLSINQIIKLLQGELLVDLDNLYHNENSSKNIKDITSVSMKISKAYKKEDIRKILNALKSNEYGQILRGKGFFNSDKGILEFNYINGDFVINNSAIETDGKMCIIGKNLNKRKIQLLFLGVR